MQPYPLHCPFNSALCFMCLCLSLLLNQGLNVCRFNFSSPGGVRRDVEAVREGIANLSRNSDSLCQTTVSTQAASTTAGSVPSCLTMSTVKPALACCACWTRSVAHIHSKLVKYEARFGLFLEFDCLWRCGALLWANNSVSEPLTL